MGGALYEHRPLSLRTIHVKLLATKSPIPMKPGRRHPDSSYLAKLLAASLAVAGGTLLAPSAHASSATWTAGGGTNDLSTGANWSVDPPNFSSGDTATFDNATSLGTLTWTTNFGPTFGATDGLHILYTGSSDLTLDSAAAGAQFGLGNITIDAAGGVFSLGDGSGIAPLVVFRGASNAQLFSNNSASAAAIKADVVFRSGGGALRTLTFEGTGNWQVDAAVKIEAGQSGAIALVKSGTGTLTLGNASNAQASNVINNGTVVLGATGALGSSVPLTIAGGTLDLNGFDAAASDFSGAGTVTSGAAGASTLTVGATTNTTFSGVIQNGFGTVGLTKRGSGSLTLTGTNTYTGNTTVNAGTLDIGGAGATGSISPSSALVMGGGTLTYSRTDGVMQTFNGTTLNAGASQIKNTASGGLSLGAITRNVGGTVDFSSTGAAINTPTANTNGILGGWATVNGTDWAVGGGDITAYASYTDDVWAAGNNTTVTTSSVLDPGSTTNSLRFNAAGANGLTLTGTNVITSGGILVTSAVGAASPSTISGGTLMGAAGQDLVVIQNNTAADSQLFIGSVVADNTSATGLTKAGAGALVLTGSNTYTGATVILGGILQLGNGGATGSISSTSQITTNGTLAINRSGATVQGTDFGAIVAGTGGLSHTGTGTVTLNVANTYSGVTAITGGGTLAVTASGALGTGSVNNIGGKLQVSNNVTLANAINTGGFNGQIENLSGDNTLSGAINFANVGSVTTAINSLAGTLTLGGAISTTLTTANRTFAFGGAGNVVSSGIISDGSATTGGFKVFLTKAGAGKLTLSGANTYTGGTSVSSGTVEVGNATGLGTGPVMIAGGVVQSSIAALTSVGTVTMTSGSLSLNTTAVGSLTLSAGGNFTMSGGGWAVTIANASSLDTIVGSGGGIFSITGGTLALSGITDYNASYSLLSGFTSGSVSGLTITGYDTTNYVATLGNNGSLTFAPVPEPSTTAALLFGSIAMFFVLRRRRETVGE